jgi:penicillin-binding protein 2
MIRKLITKNKIKTAYVDPDEIFLDAKNLQNFDQQQFEGRLEKPIPKRTILLLVFLFTFFSVIFAARLFYLQINKGEAYLARSENNTLEKSILFADRGIIYDRNKKEIAWNKKENEGDIPIRSYLSPGFSHLLGYVSYPTADKDGNFWQSEFEGKDGLEKMYSHMLNGENGYKIIEKDVTGKIYSENIINTPVKGGDLITTIDSRIQQELHQAIKNLSESNAFIGGAGIIMDVRNGEILASTSFPEYDSEILSLGENRELINTYITDKRKFFLDRTVSGLYAPGSIVKPFFALAALAEGVIDPYKEILSTGSISIPNPYRPGEKTIFKDWRVNGWTNMAEAIAVSSDIYFYEVGGGFGSQKGLGIAKLEKYARLFGIGQKTGIDLPDETSGVIPNPEWKLKNFDGDPWRIGDTYHTAIGQYGFQVTPAEMVRAVAALANRGTLVTPHFVMGDKERENDVEKIEFSDSYYDVVHQGMLEAVEYGTAVALNVPYVKAGAKTGTAQVGLSKSRINSWIVGFFPYENPKYAFTVMMEAGPTTAAGASGIMRHMFDWMNIYTPEYFTE